MRAAPSVPSPGGNALLRSRACPGNLQTKLMSRVARWLADSLHAFFARVQNACLHMCGARTPPPTHTRTRTRTRTLTHTHTHTHTYTEHVSTTRKYEDASLLLSLSLRSDMDHTICHTCVFCMCSALNATKRETGSRKSRWTDWTTATVQAEWGDDPHAVVSRPGKM